MSWLFDSHWTFFPSSVCNCEIAINIEMPTKYISMKHQTTCISVVTVIHDDIDASV